jgi:hopanoid biosynthesis associated protein HpnK
VTRRVIFTADDFGLDVAVNEAVEIAHRDGVLTSASLMVAEAAAADAVTRARALPTLRVGLHLTLVEGRPVLPASEIPVLVGPDGRFRDGMAAAGVRFCFLPHVRRQLAREIAAQFAAFVATGLRLDHADAHKHFHLHPTVAGLMIGIGRRYGLRAVRLPYEPAGPLALVEGPAKRRAGVGAAALRLWTRPLSWRLRRAGMRGNDQVFGLAWSGAMTEARVAGLLGHLPDGTSEIYFHPATRRTPALERAMPEYRHVEEFQALLSPRVRAAFATVAS